MALRCLVGPTCPRNQQLFTLKAQLSHVLTTAFFFCAFWVVLLGSKFNVLDCDFSPSLEGDGNRSFTRVNSYVKFKEMLQMMSSLKWCRVTLSTILYYYDQGCMPHVFNVAVSDDGCLTVPEWKYKNLGVNGAKTSIKVIYWKCYSVGQWIIQIQL